jgi:hypothetical protein
VLVARFLVQVRWWGAGLVLAASPRAYAQVVADLDVSATASIGVTDNVANTATPEADAGPDVVRPQADGFGSIAPSVRLQLETPSTTQTLSYAFGYTFNLINSDANNYSNGLSYGLRTPVSEVTEMSFSLAGSQATSAALQLLAPAAAGQPLPNTGSNNIMLSGGGGLGFSTELSETVSFTQALSGSYVYTLVPDGADSSTALGSITLGLNKRFLINQLAFEQKQRLPARKNRRSWGRRRSADFSGLAPWASNLDAPVQRGRHEFGRSRCRRWLRSNLGFASGRASRWYLGIQLFAALRKPGYRLHA